MTEREVISSQRISGRPAQELNIRAAKTLSSIVKTTLGPRGMDKMLVNGQGRITVTNDGVTILKEMEIGHPAAILISRIAQTQEDEVGDGTTTVTMLVGELLKNAETLILKGIHPTIISKGYQLAEKKAQEILKANAVKISDKDLLKKVAMTAMTGKGAEGYREILADLIVEAASETSKHNIKFEKIIGDSVENSRVVKGLVLDKEIPHEKMPKKLKDAKIGLLDVDLDVKPSEIDTQINLGSYQEVENFQAEEEKKFKDLAQKIIDSKVDALFCTKGINDKIFYYLAKAGIMALRRINKYDMDILSKVTGGLIVSDFEDFKEDNFGFAGKIEEERYSENETRLFIEECKDAQAVTILVHSTSDQSVQEIVRAMTDALGDVAASKDNYVVAGGGAIEIEVAKDLKAYAQTLKGREQLAVIQFAEALESIPETLAENAGLDPINILTNLRQRHEAGDNRIGLNLFIDELEDTFEAGIIEPLKIKTQAISSATEVATLILRIDDNLSAKPEGQ